MKIVQYVEPKPNPLVKVIGTGTSIHMPKGKEFMVEQSMADGLIESGRARLEGDAKPEKEKKDVKHTPKKKDAVLETPKDKV